MDSELASADPWPLRALAGATYMVMAAGFVAGLVVPARSGQVAQGVVVVTLVAFFVIGLVRLAVVGAYHPSRRAALLALMIALALWAGGSGALNASPALGSTRFPAPGEWLFLASYVGMAVFLILDGGHRPRVEVSTWLEAAVVCGGAGCLAGALVLTPAAVSFRGDGTALLLALLYPLVDVVLAVVVLAQVVLHLRALGARAGLLCAGFLLLAVGDSTFVVNLRNDTYQFGFLLDLAWGSAFGLILAAACSTRREPEQPVVRRQGSWTLVAASTVALLVLVLRPSSTLGSYLTGVALLTLVAAGGRLVLALREARQAAEAFRLSRTDDLTGLPNRRALIAEIDARLSVAGRLTLMLLDLDGFKDINDTLGHAAGDAILVTAAARMRQALPHAVLVARLGGDEFALLLREHEETVLLDTARHVREVLLQPSAVDDLVLSVNASIGIAWRVPNDVNATDLLRRADVAMYQAKLSRSGALLYDVARDDFSRQRLMLSEDLRRGIAAGQLVVWYQPQVDARTQQVTGVEALVRWQHPQQGLLQPVSFLPVARRAGHMLALSEAVITSVLADIGRWTAQGLDLRVAVNLAPPELLGGMLLPRLFAAVREAGLAPDRLVVEVTEDSFLADPERARDVLRDIRSHHIQVAIDDYGTGFSSLSYLRDLPVQELKMDRSFVATIEADARSRMIVGLTAQMTRALGLRMVAEGVEDAETEATLVSLGADVLQGYHVARPMPASAVLPWVREWEQRRDRERTTAAARR